MSLENKELSVALLPRISSLDILKTEGWYHIPVETAPKPWPPKVMAFYTQPNKSKTIGHLTWLKLKKRLTNLAALKIQVNSRETLEKNEGITLLMVRSHYEKSTKACRPIYA